VEITLYPPPPTNPTNSPLLTLTFPTNLHQEESVVINSRSVDLQAEPHPYLHEAQAVALLLGGGGEPQAALLVLLRPHPPPVDGPGPAGVPALPTSSPNVQPCTTPSED